MRLIEFLLNNIFIVVIIIGAIASFFGKAGGKRRPNQMPNFGDGGLPRRTVPQVKEREPSRERKLEQPVYREPDVLSEARDTYEGGYVPPAASAVQRPVPERPVRRTAPTPKHSVTAESGSSGGKRAGAAAAAAVQADDIRKAVIWAEILGPPRAKKPYRK